MSFCIRNELHYINENWVKQAAEALTSLTSVTKAFNNNESLAQCKECIKGVTAIGLSQPAQMYLYMASQTKRREHFNESAFKALNAQKDFIKQLEEEQLR